MPVHSHSRLLSAALLTSIAPSIVAAAAQRQPDFNADGYADLVLPVSGEKIGTNKAAGAINVIHGTANKLKAAQSQFWHQDSTDILDTAEAFDWFGEVVAWGDFNNDGYSDVAISARGEDAYAGAVQVLYGSASGLTAVGNQVWKQGSNGLTGMPEPGEEFGAAIAVGDFNGDSYDDLAVGVPDQAVNGDDYAGAVHIIFGSAGGLTSTGNQYWTQDSPGLSAAAAEYADGFGISLTAGDFNGDGKDDLAVGVPYENFAVLNCGAVNVLYGSTTGLTSVGNQFLGQDSANIADTAEADDYFGWALVAGDFNGDGRDDLAISAEGEKIGTVNEAGAVHVLYGSGQGLRIQGSQFWHQDANGIADVAETNDWFGCSLAAGDFNNDGRDDLAIGVVGESVGAKNRAGGVNVIYGSANKLVKNGNQFFSQDSNGVESVAAANDGFGALLMVGDFNGDGRDDLAVGVPYKNVGGQPDAGVINVLYSGNNGLKGPGGQLWSQDSNGIADKCEKNEFAGWGAS